MIEQFFFSKRNISLLNRVVLNTLQYQNKPKPQKKIYVQILLGNMKKVYKAIDSKKINDRNINAVLEQFNQWSIQQTIKEIRSKQKESSENPQISQLKMQRESSVKGSRDVRYMERPSFTSSSMFKDNSTKERDNFTSPNLNNMLKSNDRLSSIREENRFNNFDFTTKNSEQTEKDLEQLMRERENDVPNRMNKAKEVNFSLDQPKQENFTNLMPNMNPNSINTSMNQNNNNINNNIPNVMEFNSSDRVYNSNAVLERDLTENLNSLNNYDTLITNDIQVSEDPDPFESRLKKLQNERSSLSVAYDEVKSSANNNLKPESPPEQFTPQHQQQPQQIPIQNIPQQIPQTMNYQEDNESESPNSHIQEPQSYNKESNIDLGSYFEIIQNLNSQILELKEHNFKLLQQKPNMDEFNSIEDAKKEIANEFNKLTEKHQLVERNLQILMQKEMQVLKKEEEINQIIQNYNTVLNVSTYQVTIDSRFLDSHQESYKFELDEPIKRVVKFELVSYNIPAIKYNINNYNNTFIYQIEDNEEKEIKLDQGYYEIEFLLAQLNEKCEDLIFETNFQQTISIKSKNEEIFTIKIASLTNKVLGFNKEELKDKNSYNSNGIYELRNDNYINLHISNIITSKEFCTLNLISGQTVKKVEFDEPKDVEHLDIAFTTYENQPISFDNRYHTLTFKIIALNEPLQTTNNTIEYQQVEES